MDLPSSFSSIILGIAQQVIPQEFSTTNTARESSILTSHLASLIGLARELKTNDLQGAARLYKLLPEPLQNVIPIGIATYITTGAPPQFPVRPPDSLQVATAVQELLMAPSRTKGFLDFKAPQLQPSAPSMFNAVAWNQQAPPSPLPSVPSMFNAVAWSQRAQPSGFYGQ